MARGNRRRSPFAEWKSFSRRHRGNPLLESDPIYALPEPLIDAIKTELPDFFTEGQVSFERDLTRTASFGFFHHNAIGIPAGEDVPDPRTGVSQKQRVERTMAEIKEIFKEDLLDRGLRSDEIDEHIDAVETTAKDVQKRKHAYVGWLICNHHFHEEVAALREAWGGLVEQLGRFPRFPRWPDFGGTAGTEHEHAFREVMYPFYRRWGLDRMLTWDWPIPMEPDLATGMLEEVKELSEAGIVLVVPWYLLRGDKLDMRHIVRQARAACKSAHLYDWLGLGSARKGESGEISFAHLSEVYQYYELVLKRRYRDACKGNLPNLDRALATFMKRNEETVRKLRQKLERSRR